MRESEEREREVIYKILQKKEKRYIMMSKIYRRKYLKNFNPENPSEEILDVISKEKTNGTGRLNPSTRNKYLTEFNIDILEFLAFKYDNASDRLKLLAQLQFFIKLNQELETVHLNIDDLKEAFKDCFGFDYSVAKAEPTPLPPKAKPTTTDDVLCNKCNLLKDSCECEW